MFAEDLISETKNDPVFMKRIVTEQMGIRRGNKSAVARVALGKQT